MKNLMIFIITFTASQAFATSQSLELMTDKLIQLRMQVEELGRESQQAQKESSASLDPYLQRKTEIEALIMKERLRGLQLNEKLKQTQKTTKSSGGKTAATDWTGLTEWCDKLRSTVKGSLPFQLDQRNLKVSEVCQKISKKEESPLALAGELWALTEQEMHLTARNEYLISKIELKGKPVEAEIVRLGLVQMLFRTSGGEYGFANQNGDKWELVTTQDEKQIQAIGRVLSKFKSKEVTGWFEVPMQNLGEISL